MISLTIGSGGEQVWISPQRILSVREVHHTELTEDGYIKADGAAWIMYPMKAKCVRRPKSYVDIDQGKEHRVAFAAESPQDIALKIKESST